MPPLPWRAVEGWRLALQGAGCARAWASAMRANDEAAGDALAAGRVPARGLSDRQVSVDWGDDATTARWLGRMLACGLAPDTRLPGAFGHTLLHFHAISSHPDTVAVLLAHGASAAVLNHAAQTPLDACLAEARDAWPCPAPLVACAHRLLDAGAPLPSLAQCPLDASLVARLARAGATSGDALVARSFRLIPAADLGPWLDTLAGLGLDSTLDAWTSAPLAWRLLAQPSHTPPVTQLAHLARLGHPVTGVDRRGRGLLQAWARAKSAPRWYLAWGEALLALPAFQAILGVPDQRGHTVRALLDRRAGILEGMDESLAGPGLQAVRSAQALLAAHERRARYGREWSAAPAAAPRGRL